MKEKTDWTTGSKIGNVHTSGSQSGKGTGRNRGEKEGPDFSQRSSSTSSEPARPALLKDRNIVKAGFAVIAGILIAAMAKGVKDSDYYDD